MLILTLLTATVVIALFSGLTVWYDRPLRVSEVELDGEQHLAGEREPVKPMLGPLKSRPSYVEASAGTDNYELNRATGTLSVSLSGVTKSSAGKEIAILDGNSGSRIAYHRLEADTASLGFAGLPAGTHWLVAYDAKASARHAYTQRVRIDITAGTLARQELSLETHPLFLTVIETGQGSGPTGMVVAILERSDDPYWRQSQAIRAMPDPRGIQLQIQGLSPGDYLLSIPGFELEGSKRLAIEIRGRTGLELRGSWREPL